MKNMDLGKAKSALVDIIYDLAPDVANEVDATSTTIAALVEEAEYWLETIHEPNNEICMEYLEALRDEWEPDRDQIIKDYRTVVGKLRRYIRRYKPFT